MSELTLGALGTSRKENEFRLPIHPRHFETIPPELRASIFVEDGYASRFETRPSELDEMFAGVRSQDELFQQCDVILLPKPQSEDLLEMHEGQVLWGWPHCVQNEKLTQVAIDRKLTLIAWEAMNLWHADGSFNLHVFHKNNELAGFCSVLHALRSMGLTGQYGRELRAAVISYGATGRGAVTALTTQGISDVTVLSQREPAQVASPSHSARFVQFEAEDDGSNRWRVISDDGRKPMVDVLAEHDIVVNCFFQDPETPYIFVTRSDLDHFAPGTLMIAVSCDEGMGFEWARSTEFTDPILRIGGDVHYYAVDHSPSYLWDSASWEVSAALLGYLAPVMEGSTAWQADETIRRAIEIQNGVIQNPKILSFQHRSSKYPHVKIPTA
jgi:alanine dehydrogenase